jgi:ubiquinone/menaquinone biosynthesis C-methylase UbiE
VKDVQVYYDDFSTTYDRGRDRGYHAHIDDLEAACVQRWKRGERVLELGCGTGLVLERVRAFAPAAGGADLSHGMLRRARARGLPVVQASALALPYRDGSLDLVYSFKVLPHVERLDVALAEVGRVLAPGGAALLEFYNPVSLRGLWKKLRWWKAPVGAGSHDREVFTAYHTPERARAAAAAAGLEVEGACGIVLLTPHPIAHRVPLLGAMLRAFERALAESPLACWAGFYVVIARRPAQSEGAARGSVRA